MSGEHEGHASPNLFNMSDFRNINVLSENFHTSAVGKDAAFKLYRKIF